MSQVNNFLASVQQEASASGSNADLSTPAARRAHLLSRVEASPRDSEAWLTLLADCEARLAEGESIEQVRQTYEDFFKVYPNAARQWQSLIDLELSLGNFKEVEQLFTRCLRTTPSVSLWKAYLNYTRRVNPLPAPSATASGDDEGEHGRVRKLIEEAYDFAVRHVGMSRDAGDIWMEYLRFVKEREAKTSWLQGQKMDDMRRIFQRVVGVPVANVEQIWREYDQFENGLNRVTAKKFLAERSPAYMTARSALREMRGLVDPLHRPLLPRLPAWIASVDSPAESDVTRDRERLQGWKAYLQWEESDPLELAATDTDALNKRVSVAYAKATMHMRFYPEIWYMAAKWAESHSPNPNEATQWLKDGLDANPGSFLLSFALVESGEARGATSECAGIFEALLAQVHKRIETLAASLDEQLAKIDTAGQEVRAAALAARRAGGEADEIEGEEREEERKRELARDAEKEALRSTTQPRIESLKEESSLVWIKWMHHVRRTEGLRPTRAVFSKARKSPHCTWQVYEASALMEYHCSKDAGVATKVFELALKTFGSDEAFVVRYLDFLISINDDNNARALFERTITTFQPAERARPIWDRWSSYEYSFGDSTSIKKLEARLAEAFPDEAPLKRLMDRSTYMDLEVIGPRDLGIVNTYGATAADRAVATAAAAAGAVGGEEAAATTTNGSKDAAIAAKAAAAAAAVSAAAATKRPADDMSRRGNSPAVGEGGNKRMRGGAGAGASERDLAPPPPQRRGPLPPQNSAFGAGGAVAANNGGAPGLPPIPPSSAAGAPAPNVLAERPLPDAVLFFLSILPSLRSWDGPRLPAGEIMDVLRGATLPGPGPGQGQGGPGQGQGMGGPPQRGGWGAQRGGMQGGMGTAGGMRGGPMGAAAGRGMPMAGGRRY
ncbi:Suf-domain-containing protein [Jaminaea rosea]|uniref:mRNA 3'-end-processing protein RNA14 n=1 Tax=Jaminaea rosea TaxID=1569628 RepID=A0A316UX79_9BASI|nr:Suf-domain-containing protein [Jaminaea rosea]PWN29899.1 Suf-domain-containing protein [Jaminaea rosea]